MDAVFTKSEGILIDNYYSLTLVNEYIKQRGRLNLKHYSVTNQIDNLIKFNADYPIILYYNQEIDRFSLFSESEEPSFSIIDMEEFSKRLHKTNYFKEEEETYYNISLLLPRLKPYIYNVLDGRLAIKVNKDNFKSVIEKLYKDMELEPSLEVYLEEYLLVAYNVQQGQFEYLDTFYGRIVEGDEFVSGVNQETKRENCW